MSSDDHSDAIKFSEITGRQSEDWWSKYKFWRHSDASRWDNGALITTTSMVNKYTSDSSPHATTICSFIAPVSAKYGIYYNAGSYSNKHQKIFVNEVEKAVHLDTAGETGPRYLSANANLGDKVRIEILSPDGGDTRMQVEKIVFKSPYSSDQLRTLMGSCT